MNTSILRRLKALERDAPRGGAVIGETVLNLGGLTEEERFDLCAYAFCSVGSRPWPTHRPRREKAYYAALIDKATGGNREGAVYGAD